MQLYTARYGGHVLESTFEASFTHARMPLGAILVCLICPSICRLLGATFKYVYATRHTIRFLRIRWAVVAIASRMCFLLAATHELDFGVHVIHEFDFAGACDSRV